MRQETYPEKHDSLWILTVAPTIWACHFLLCYCSAAIFCAKAGSLAADLNSIRMAIAVYTVLALSGIGVTAAYGYRRRDAVAPAQAGNPQGARYRFIGFATLLLCGVSALATIFVALVAVFFENCR